MYSIHELVRLTLQVDLVKSDRVDYFLEMQICLFRHGDRENRLILNKSEPELTKRGFAQAQNLVSLVQQNKLPQPQKIFVSPRIRTQQTFKPTSIAYDIEMQISPELDERSSEESAVEFRQRVKKFVHFLEKQNVTCFVCTHFDWVEEVASVLNFSDQFHPGDWMGWAPGQFQLFDVQDNIWHPIQKGVLQC